MIALLDTVILTRDLPEEGLKAGDKGAVVEIYAGREGYEVEFFNEAGDTKAVITVGAGDLREDVE